MFFLSPLSFETNQNLTRDSPFEKLHRFQEYSENYK